MANPGNLSWLQIGFIFFMIVNIIEPTYAVWFYKEKNYQGKFSIESHEFGV